MKTFKDLLSDIAEKESDADYDRRMRKTAQADVQPECERKSVPLVQILPIFYLDQS